MCSVCSSLSCSVPRIGFVSTKTLTRIKWVVQINECIFPSPSSPIHHPSHLHVRKDMGVSKRNGDRKRSQKRTKLGWALNKVPARLTDYRSSGGLED